jgi:hypothetical protein
VGEEAGEVVFSDHPFLKPLTTTLVAYFFAEAYNEEDRCVFIEEGTSNDDENRRRKT